MAEPGKALNDNSYVPILKSKQGEFGALTQMRADSRVRTVPLIELMVDRVSGLIGAWSGERSAVFVQPLDLHEMDPTEWAAKVGVVFEELRAGDVDALPCVTPDETNDVLAAVEQVAATDGYGLCIRVDSEEYALQSQGNVQTELQRVLDLTATPKSDVDLLIDCGLVRDSVTTRVATAESVIRVLPWLDEWRSVVVAFSAFPERPGEVAQKNAVTPIARSDAESFAHLMARGQGRGLVYSDYAVGVPFYSEGGWAPIPSIKYAVDLVWMIHRAATKTDPTPQYIGLAAGLAAEAYFDGAAFSPGDEYIADVASGSGGPGNATTYLRTAMSRHFEVVLARLDTLGVP